MAMAAQDLDQLEQAFGTGHAAKPSTISCQFLAV
jgi:hypothetical protein